MILRDMSDRAGIYMRLYIFLHTSITNWLNQKKTLHIHLGSLGAN